jgi:hypothetical protein
MRRIYLPGIYLRWKGRVAGCILVLQPVTAVTLISLRLQTKTASWDADGFVS